MRVPLAAPLACQKPFLSGALLVGVAFLLTAALVFAPHAVRAQAVAGSNTMGASPARAGSGRLAHRG
jgi:uncharacterized membrane protein